MEISQETLEKLIQSGNFTSQPFDKPKTEIDLKVLEGPDGLIPESSSYDAIRTCALSIYLKHPDFKVDEIFKMTLDILNPLVYRQKEVANGITIKKTGWFTTTWIMRDAQIKQMISEEIADAFQTVNKKALREKFENQHKPSAGKFLESCKKFWPNVNAVYVGQAATSLSRYIENIMSNVGVNGAQHQNIMLYMFSALGGTGKGTTMRRFEHWAMSRNVPLAAQTTISSKWAPPDFATSYIATVNEFFPLKGQETDAIANINNIVDNQEYISEKKCVQPIQLRSISSVMVGANYLPYDKNDRRYALVQFNNKSLLHPSEEDKRYIVERTDDEWDSIIDDLFESVVFGADYTIYDKKQINPQYIDIIAWMQDAMSAGLGNVCDMTISAFVNLACATDPTGNTTENRRHKRMDVLNCMRMLYDCGYTQVLTQRINGNFEYSRYDFSQIDNLTVGSKSARSKYDYIPSLLEASDMAWDDLIALFDENTESIVDFPDPEEELPIEETAYYKAMSKLYEDGKLSFPERKIE